MLFHLECSRDVPVTSALLRIDPKFGDVPIAHIASLVDVARAIIGAG
jgi:hypothetical protein